MYNELLDKQKEYFLSDKTMSLSTRFEALKKLKNIIKANYKDILNALMIDLGKDEGEALSSEISIINAEIDYYLKNLKKLAKAKKVRTPLMLFKAKSYIEKRPYGNILVISPWNYPFLLALDPMIEAIASGNTVIVKPSELSNESSLVLEKMIKEFDNEGLIACVLGDKIAASKLLELPFNYIFYTGGDRVGKIVAEAAAKKLIPYALELGGKSPVIVDSSANIKLSAKRIAFAKCLNMGQTCVAPDYILVSNDIIDEFVKELKNELQIQQKSTNKMISINHYNRMKELLDGVDTYFGNEFDDENLRLSQTIVVNPDMSSRLMQEEIFGPILPVIGFDSFDEVIEDLKRKPSPLALYLYTNNKYSTKKIKTIRFGSLAINDSLIMLANHNLPFGGIGNSGNGSYHGKYGYDLFSHECACLKTSTRIDLPFRYDTVKYLGIIKKIVK